MRTLDNLITDPRYCLGENPQISKDLWIKAAMRNIGEIGIEKFLRTMLDNLDRP